MLINWLLHGRQDQNSIRFRLYDFSCWSQVQIIKENSHCQTYKWTIAKDQLFSKQVFYLAHTHKYFQEFPAQENAQFFPFQNSQQNNKNCYEELRTFIKEPSKRYKTDKSNARVKGHHLLLLRHMLAKNNAINFPYRNKEVVRLADDREYWNIIGFIILSILFY